MAIHNRNIIHRVINELPSEAVTVKEFATSYPCDTSYIYKLSKLSRDNGKILPFEIVSFKGVNFVIGSK
jgi:hypothetical protein